MSEKGRGSGNSDILARSYFALTEDAYTISILPSIFFLILFEFELEVKVPEADNFSLEELLGKVHC